MGSRVREPLIEDIANRFRSLLGKARAAKEAGELAVSREAYQKLVALIGQAGAGRPELAEAKAFLTN